MSQAPRRWPNLIFPRCPRQVAPMTKHLCRLPRAADLAASDRSTIRYGRVSAAARHLARSRPTPGAPVWPHAMPCSFARCITDAPPNRCRQRRPLSSGVSARPECRTSADYSNAPKSSGSSRQKRLRRPARPSSDRATTSDRNSPPQGQSTPSPPTNGRAQRSSPGEPDGPNRSHPGRCPCRASPAASAAATPLRASNAARATHAIAAALLRA